MTTATLRSEAQAILDAYLKSLPADVAPDYARRARAFLVWHGTKPLDRQHVDAYIAHLQARGQAKSTIRQTWQVIHRLFVVNKLDWPFGKGDAPDPGQTAPPALMLETVEQLINAAKRMPPMYGAFLALSTIYGVRRIEIVDMAPNPDSKGTWLNPLRAGASERFVHIETGKSGRPRWHLCPPEVYQYLERWGFKEYKNTVEVSMAFRAIVNAAHGDLPKGVGWHSLRHSLDYYLLARKVPLSDVRHFMRWAAEGMAEQYRHVEMMGFGGKRDQGLPSLDRDSDQSIFAVHPFLGYWK